MIINRAKGKNENADIEEALNPKGKKEELTFSKGLKTFW